MTEITFTLDGPDDDGAWLRESARQQINGFSEIWQRNWTDYFRWLGSVDYLERE